MSVAAPPASAAPAPRRPLERFLCLFADVRDGEGPQLLLLALNVFLILTAYYVMKPVREALILAQPGGAEIKSYAYAAQAALFVVLIPMYSALATRLPRRRLINVVTSLFIACLPVFYMFAQQRIPIGMVFFLWIGVFSLMVIAQFWSYANDVYSPDAGKRLFAVIGFGASSGAVFGSWLSSVLIRQLGVNPLLLVAVTILATSLLLFNIIDLRERTAGGRARGGEHDPGAVLRPRDVAIGEGAAFSLLMRNRYLLLIALITFFLNWVNSAGEYILSAVVKHDADLAVATGSITLAEQGRYIGTFFADYFHIVNIVGMLLQLFVVSRAIKYLGVPGQDRRELGRLLAHEHRAAAAFPADTAQREVQGEAADRLSRGAHRRRPVCGYGVCRHRGADAQRVAVRLDQRGGGDRLARAVDRDRARVPAAGGGARPAQPRPQRYASGGGLTT